MYYMIKKYLLGQNHIITAEGIRHNVNKHNYFYRIYANYANKFMHKFMIYVIKFMDINEGPVSPQKNQTKSKERDSI